MLHEFEICYKYPLIILNVIVVVNVDWFKHICIVKIKIIYIEKISPTHKCIDFAYTMRRHTNVLTSFASDCLTLYLVIK